MSEDIMSGTYEDAVKEIFDTAATLARNTVLDQVWRALDALSEDVVSDGPIEETYLEAYCDAVDDALAIIEKLGGMDPEKRGEQ